MSPSLSTPTMEMQYAKTLRSRFLRRGSLAVVLLACGAAAMAQEARDDAVTIDGSTRHAARGLDLGPISGLSIVELSPAGPNQRPKRALRMRMDSATRALRGFGVDAEDCSSLLRTNFRSHSVDALGGQPANVGVSLALNCRFF